jgi:hypothetical protein
MRTKILDYYKSLLALGWLYADDEGLINAQMGDVTMPATVNKKRLILPTIAQMKNRDWKERIAFHPISEQLNLGVSDVLADFRKQVEARLNISIAFLMKELIRIAVDTEGQKNLTSEQGQVLNVLSKAKTRTKEKFDELTKKLKSSGTSNAFLNLYIRNGGMVGGKGYARAGIATFPLYTELAQGDKIVQGVKFTGEDREMFKALFEFIFPTLATDPEWYNVGVNARTAPTLEAFVRVTMRIVTDLMSAARPYLDIMPGAPILLGFPEDLGQWIELMDDTEQFERARRAIPTQDGNEGDDDVNANSGKAEPLKTSEVSERREDVRDAPAQGTAVVNDAVQEAVSRFRPRGSILPANQDPMKVQVKTTQQVPPQSGINHAALERERREREKQEDEEYERKRQRRREEDEEEEDRRRERRRERDREDRDRDDDRRRRDRDDDDDRRRDRDDDDDRGRKRSIWDNPVMRDRLDDAEDDEAYVRRRDRYRERDDRDDRYDDRRRSRSRFDRDDDYDDRYDRSRSRSRFRR